MPAWSRPIAASVRERRPSTANKYQHVKSVLDTGFNELKAKAQNQDGRPQARFQHGDPFKRIKARHLAELMSGHRLGYDCLLLDVRDVEEFNLCHLKGAMSYPARLLSRAVNPLSKEVLEHVNVQSSIIVLYDLDGKIAAPACALLSEKGVENVALLHGGLWAFAAKNAGLLEGESPSLCSPRQTASLAGKNFHQRHL